MNDTATVRRLGPGDEALASRTFATMADVFEEPSAPLPEAYVSELLARRDFIALTAVVDGVPIGGLTAHVLPLTRIPEREVFLYDIAVREDRQRRGVGRLLVDALRALARAEGIRVVFVPADDEDGHALDFYRALGGDAAKVTIFTFEDALG